MKEKIEEAIQEYNKYRAPEAKARLLSFNKEYFKVKFGRKFLL